MAFTQAGAYPRLLGVSEHVSRLLTVVAAAATAAALSTVATSLGLAASTLGTLPGPHSRHRAVVLLLCRRWSHRRHHVMGQPAVVRPELVGSGA